MKVSLYLKNPYIYQNYYLLGVIFIFKWDDFGDCKDRIVGHPNSIDAMVIYYKYYMKIKRKM